MRIEKGGRVKLAAAKLRSVWLFSGVSDEGLESLASLFTTRACGPGEVLFNVGDQVGASNRHSGSEAPHAVQSRSVGRVGGWVGGGRGR